MRDDRRKLLKTISFHRSFVDIGGSVTSAVFLSQALFWSESDLAEERGGWFWKTSEQWERETGLTRREQDTARERLRAAGVLEEKLQGVPARMNYRVKWDELFEALSSLAESAKQGCTKAPSKPDGISQTSIEGVETTKENTEREPLNGHEETLFPQDRKPSPEKERKSCAKKKESGYFRVMPAALNSEEFTKAFCEYIEYRKQRRLPRLLELSVEIKLKEMAEWGLADALQSIHDCIANGWTGLFRPRPTPVQIRGTNGHAAPAPKKVLTNTEKRAIFKANGGRDEDNPY